MRHVVLAGRVGVAEHSESEMGSRRKQRLARSEFEQLLYGGGCNRVGVTEVWLRWLLSELGRLLQVLFCVVCALEQRGLQWLCVSGRGRDVSGFGGIGWLCAFRDAAREGAANSYSEARARKVSSRITPSPPYSNKLTLL